MLWAAVMVCATAALVQANQEADLYEIVTIHNDVDAVRCNSTDRDYEQYYNRLQTRIRSEGEYDHYFPDVLCYTEAKVYIGKVELDTCCKNSTHKFFNSGFVSCSDYLNQSIPAKLPISYASASSFFRNVLCQDIPTSIPQSALQLCLRIRSNRYNIHACYNTTGVVSYTPDAAKANLLDIVNVPAKNVLYFLNANLVRLPRILNKAFLTCSVKNGSYSAIQFVGLRILQGSNPTSPLFSAPFGVKSFLRAGEMMHAHCGYSVLIKLSLFFEYAWKHNGNELPECVTVKDDLNCTQNRSRVEYLTPSEYITGTQCKDSPTWIVKRITLVIHEAQAEDVGQYTCSSIQVDDNREERYLAGTVYVVYVEFPSSPSMTIEGSNPVFNCSVQAPTAASLQWIADRRGRAPLMMDGMAVGASCENQQNGTVFSSLFVRNGSVDGFSFFTLLLHICNASVNHVDQYSCVVTSNGMTQEARLSFSLDIKDDSRGGTDGNREGGGTDNGSEQLTNQPALLATVLPILLVMVLGAVACITLVVVAVIVKQRREANSDDDHKKVSQHSLQYEYPRNNLITIKKLASGRFGQVYKAKADGILPHTSGRNIVAVKTLKDNSLPSELTDLLGELELMKKIKPHPNICNFLAQCTLPTEQSPCIIIEYAVHGSLRDLLIACREAMECAKEPVRLLFHEDVCVSRSAVYLNKTDLLKKEKMEKECDDEDQAAMHFIDVPVDSTCRPQIDYTASPGGIYEEDVVRFCQQILSGLCHLHTLKILHRDISARNILIANGFLLKVSDFGFARDISDTEYYRKLTDGLIPVKWAAIEALQRQIYTHKSDIWSFGVLVWEMTSYGSAPYSSISLSYGWDDLIKHLLDGHRLPAPPGCSNDLYNMMQQCWQADPSGRPSSSQLKSQCFVGNRYSL